ncbi:MAG TPA: tRNA (adenosine(37)-N6)-threonylcarbamoyltransferase complex ATPase subunit type 1 TsaE [Anaerolineaceae bacterium]|nr:tRNA (adenosine(37)-N6)-threonylcarbamoyltransferase complex ATPase subunit type 1 TsaE [Anaerolineaceae bacterium]
MPILDSHTLEFFSCSPEQTRRLGMRLGAFLQVSDCVCLTGDLGSGKTTLVQGISQGWGSLDPVSSPTFVLVNQYRRPTGESLYHMDAYRIANALEAEELDLDLMLGQGALVIEWAERILPALPRERLVIQMRWVADEQRGMVLTPYGERYKSLLDAIRQRMIGV